MKGSSFWIKDLNYNLLYIEKLETRLYILVNRSVLLIYDGRIIVFTDKNQCNPVTRMDKLIFFTELRKPTRPGDESNNLNLHNSPL